MDNDADADADLASLTSETYIDIYRACVSYTLLISGRGGELTCTP